MTQAPAFESDQELLKLAQGLRDAFGAPAPVALSRRTVVGFRGKAKLYYYPPKDGGRFKTPLVLFPYLGISRPTFSTFAPASRSLSSYEQGILLPLRLGASSVPRTATWAWTTSSAT
ncbi:MAG: hypothetical protein IPN07_07170 [Dehalococcoidia bacterium]|nr:hypothetical protein [Dehalococcoidia bacterium]